MAIKRYVEKGTVFAPEAISSMSKALEATTEILGIGGDEKKRQTVARFIIRLVQEDGRLDGAALRDRAVAALGGADYFALVGDALETPRARDQGLTTRVLRPAVSQGAADR
jgi:hypothetical protein